MADPYQARGGDGRVNAPARPPQVRTNGLAIASFVLGIIWIYWIGSILALVFGYIALRQIRQSSGAQEGRGLAVAGVVLGWVGAATLVLVLILAVAVANEADDINDAFAEADTTDESGPIDDEFTGDGIPPEEFEPAQLADCHLMRDYQNRPVVVASTVSGQPAVIDFEVEYVDGHTETFTVEYPDYAGKSIFVNGSEACTVTAVRER